MTITIDGPKALKLLRGAVKLKGADYIDPIAADGGSCNYVIGGAPSCIVGHVIANVKPDLIPVIEVWERNEYSPDDDDYDDYEGYRTPTLDEGNNGGTSADELIEAIAASGVDLVFSDAARHAFNAAQREQDAGKTWGEALDAAKKAVEA